MSKKNNKTETEETMTRLVEIIGDLLKESERLKATIADLEDQVLFAELESEGLEDEKEELEERLEYLEQLVSMVPELDKDYKKFCEEEDE